MIGLVRPDHALVISSLGDPVWTSEGLAGIGEQLRASAASMLEAGPSVVAGIGGPRFSLADVADSYSEALLAARVAEVVSSMGPGGGMVGAGDLPSCSAAFRWSGSLGRAPPRFGSVSPTSRWDQAA